MQNEANRKFLQGFAETLRSKVYDSEAFDEHLDVGEYLILRDVTKEID